MRALFKLMTGYLAWLCKVLQVTPASLRQGRRGNLPPPSGGIASFYSGIVAVRMAAARDRPGPAHRIPRS